MDFWWNCGIDIISIILMLAFIPKWNHQKDESLENPLGLVHLQMYGKINSLSV